MEGGLITTDDEELYQIMLCLRAHGWTRNLPTNNLLTGTKNEKEFEEFFKFVLPGYNLRPLEISGAIGQEQIKKFLDVLKMDYDYVIIDSPPVQPVSDTLILAQATDFNLFLIRSEATRTVTFMSSIKKIQNVGSKIHGIVINDLDTSKDSYYAYYYNYSPHYYNYNNYYRSKT